MCVNYRGGVSSIDDWYSIYHKGTIDTRFPLICRQDQTYKGNEIIAQLCIIFHTNLSINYLNIIQLLNPFTTVVINWKHRNNGSPVLIFDVILYFYAIIFSSVSPVSIVLVIGFTCDDFQIYLDPLQGFYITLHISFLIIP